MRNRFFKVLGLLIVVALLVLLVTLRKAGKESGVKKSEQQMASSSETNIDLGPPPPPLPKEIEEITSNTIALCKQHPIERPANFSDTPPPTFGSETEVISSNFTWGVVTNGLQYGISLEKDTYKVGESILVTKVLTNMGSPRLRFEALESGRAAVLDENGVKVSYSKEYEASVGQLRSGSFFYIRHFQRGMHWSDTPSDLAAQFDLSKPGNYSVSATRGIWLGEKVLRVPSGVIKFKIVEEKKKP